MFYYLFYSLIHLWSGFNVFRYITFRSVYAFITALLLSLILGPYFINWLKRLNFGQYIQNEVKNHSSKHGTPTMGGLLIGFCVLVSVFLWANLTNKYIWMTVFVYIGFGLIGFYDDYLKIIRKNNQGLSARHKMLAQVIVAIGVLALLFKWQGFNTYLLIPFFKHLHPYLGWFYIPFAIIVMVGSSNGVNLTDGLDGLAIGPSVVCAACFAIFVYVTGHFYLAKYLQIPYLAGVGEVAVFCSALAGAGLGFLWYNAYPAEIFMGDVGSLSIGGVLGFIALVCKQELLLLIVGGLFVVETLSVVVQVGYFKLTKGKRFFKMAPLHHHFELQGIPESKIVIRFWILSILLALVALSTLKLR